MSSVAVLLGAVVLDFSFAGTAGRPAAPHWDESSRPRNTELDRRRLLATEHRRACDEVLKHP